MTVKFKIGFQIDAETLFGIIAKFLPLDNLSVEEVVERPHAHTPRLAAAPKLAAPKPKLKRNSKPPNLERGINAIILGALVDGEPHPPIDMKNAIIAHGGYSPDSLSSRLVSLIQQGHVVRAGHGKYAKSKR